MNTIEQTTYTINREQLANYVDALPEEKVIEGEVSTFADNMLITLVEDSGIAVFTSFQHTDEKGLRFFIGEYAIHQNKISLMPGSSPEYFEEKMKEFNVTIEKNL